jgi:hypothetical protein
MRARSSVRIRKTGFRKPTTLAPVRSGRWNTAGLPGTNAPCHTACGWPLSDVYLKHGICMLMTPIPIGLPLPLIGSVPINVVAVPLLPVNAPCLIFIATPLMVVFVSLVVIPLLVVPLLVILLLLVLILTTLTFAVFLHLRIGGSKQCQAQEKRRQYFFHKNSNRSICHIGRSQ